MGDRDNDYDQLIRPAIKALAGEDVLVVVTTASHPPSAIGIEPLLANVRGEQFIPYRHLMTHVDLLLTNGGFGSVQIALAHGVPVVAIGKIEEKPEIANRVQWSGAGVGIKSNKPSERQILSAVREVLGSSAYSTRAEAMQRELTRPNPVETSAALLEELTDEEIAEIA